MYSFLVKIPGSNTDYKYYNNGWTTDSMEVAMETYKNLLNTYFPKDIKFIKNLQEPQLIVAEYDKSNFITPKAFNVNTNSGTIKLNFEMPDTYVIYDYSDKFKNEMSEYLASLGITEITFDPCDGIEGKTSKTIESISFVLKPSSLKVYNWVDKKDNYTNDIFVASYTAAVSDNI